MAGECKFKVIVIGDSGTGKTSMVSSIMGETFNKTYIQTQGVNRKTFNTFCYGNKVSLDLWDLSGSDDFITITTGYYNDADAVIITYCKNNRTSFDNVSKWYQNFCMELDRIGERSVQSVQVTIVGLKGDSKREEVTVEEGKSKAQNIGVPHHFTASSLFPNTFQKMIESLVVRLMDAARVSRRNSQRLRETIENVDDDLTAQLLRKSENSKSICDCGCSCVVL